jgi:hypothetical protein
VARVYPGFSAEEVVIFGCFSEDAVVRIRHFACYQRVPVLLDPSSMPALQSVLFTHELYEKLLIPKSIRQGS